MQSGSSSVQNISQATLKSLDAILHTDKPHIKKAIQVFEDTFEKFNPSKVWFSLNAGKDNTVALYILAAVCYKRHLHKIKGGVLPPDTKFTKLVSSYSHF